MKRVVYSNITKTAVFLISLAAVFAAVCISGGFIGNYHEKYGETGLAIDPEREAAMPAREIYSSVNIYVSEKEYEKEYKAAAAESEDEDAGDVETPPEPSGSPAEELKRNIAFTVSSYPEGAVDYYIETDGIKLDSGKKLDDYKESDYRYIYYSTPSDVYLEDTIDAGVFATDRQMKVYIAVDNDYAESILLKAEECGTVFGNALRDIVFLGIIWLASFIYLMFVCGRKYGGSEIHGLLADRMYSEITLALACGIGIGGTCAVAVILLDVVSRSNDGMIFAAAGIGVLTAAAVTALAQSMIRNIKSKRFLERSVIFKALKLLWRGIKAVCRFIKRACLRIADSARILGAQKAGATAAAALAVYTVIVLIFGIIGALIAFAAACVALALRFKELDEIKRGIDEIRGGNLSYKIEPLKSPDYGILAKSINEIGGGMASSVEERVRAERMKTELITNVSHDLKTPLTSIINYTKLLLDMELKPDEAADYVRIIEKKSDRLKKLTADLFDISKIRSGNEDIKLERLNIGLLINQTMGELDNEIKNSGLEFIVKTDDELFITADGRKLSRVMNNLIGNILKYAMHGTRVYITAERRGEKAAVELKNIASYRMEFDDNEITERFVRGDKSRTEDGNGLGLAIAKSYTEACGGTFAVRTDGDLFKVIMEFDAD